MSVINGKINLDNTIDFSKSLPDCVSDKVFRLCKKIKVMNNSPLKEQCEKQIFQKSIDHLFRKTPPLFNGEIVVKAIVAGDGLGDWGHAISGAEVIRAAFPHAKIRVIISSAPIHEGKFSPPPKELCETSMRYGMGLSNEMAEQIENAFLVIGMSGKVFALDQEWMDSLKKKDPIKFMHFDEYGELDPYEEGENAMGFDPLQEGIFFKDLEKGSFLKLKDPMLKNYLFGSEQVTEDHIAFYKAQQDQAFGYFHKEGPFRKTFFCLQVLLHRESQKDLDLFMTLPKEEIAFAKDFLQEQGISKVIFTHKKQHGFEEETINISPSGKTIRVISPFPVQDQNDLYMLMSESDFVVGSRGDQSITELFSLSLALFYDIRNCKGKFFYQMLSLAHGRLGKESPFVQYLSSLYQLFKDTRGTYDEKLLLEVVATLAKFIMTPEFKTDTQGFNEHVRKHYNFNEVLIDKILHATFLKAHLNLLNKEKELEQLFRKGEMTLEQCVNEIKLQISLINNDSNH